MPRKLTYKRYATRKGQKRASTLLRQRIGTERLIILEYKESKKAPKKPYLLSWWKDI